MKINNKGYTLVEMLAVVAILGMLVAIMAPNVGKLINENKENNVKQIKNSIKNAAKIYISDYKYDIKLNGVCNNSTDLLNINKISTNSLSGGKILVKDLISYGYLKTDKNGEIINPLNKKEKLVLYDISGTIEDDSSYIIVKYNCKTKDYIYESDLYESLGLNWK